MYFYKGFLSKTMYKMKKSIGQDKKDICIYNEFMNKRQTHKNGDNALNEFESEIKEMEQILEDLSLHEPINKTENNDSINQGDKIRILREITYKIFNTLTAREERLIRMYYGYGLNHSLEVYEMAKQFDLSEAIIRQQLSTAFRKFLKEYFIQVQPKQRAF